MRAIHKINVIPNFNLSIRFLCVLYVIYLEHFSVRDKDKDKDKEKEKEKEKIRYGQCVWFVDPYLSLTLPHGYLS